MLEGLDKIDWKSLGFHIYGKNEEIPKKIRTLVSQDPEVREEARGFLLGAQQDFGDIYDTTPYIIPFLIEILAHDDTPGKADLLFHLSGVAEHTFKPEAASIHMMRLCLETYDALKTGLNILTNLLGDHSAAVRLASANLLQYMTDEVEILIPELMERFHNEQDEDVRVELLNSLKTLLSSLEWPRFQLKTQYAPFFKEVIEHSTSRKIRGAAARASVELVSRYAREYDHLSSQVPAILAQEVLELVSYPNDPAKRNLLYEIENIVRDLSRLEPEPLLDLLKNPDISKHIVHIVMRGLLANAFLFFYDQSEHWRHFPDIYKTEAGMFYIQHHGAARSIDHRQKRILQAVVDAKKVWEIPTNLFSFFYGLPDSREALQALLTE